MKLLVGLGNPGKKYERTRHNVGFLVVDEIAKQLRVEFKLKTGLEAEIAEYDGTSTTTPLSPPCKGGERIALLKPQTFMNVSGRAVKAFCAKHKCSPSDILVIYDDADLPFGDIRFKAAGSSGGHNGMQSIIEQFPNGTPIARIRVGIGRPVNPDVPLDAFVLQKWTEEENKKLSGVIKQAIGKVEECKSEKV